MSSAMNKVKQCEAIIGYEFANKARGIEALYAFPGYRREPGSNLKKNDALAIFGEVRKFVPAMAQNESLNWCLLPI
ncbi:hypothetical protein LTR93_003628 [Exophiala xenobiotica]|nr:hypothetical protein LTR93_003628 [Exophiala xenobiotica]